MISQGPLIAAILVAIAAGFVSFASPCVLPLVPGFLGYVTGLGDTALVDRPRRRMVLGALLFVLGFSLVFTFAVVSASVVADALREHQDLLIRLGGLVVIVMGLVFLGVGDRWGSQRTVRTGWRPVAGLAGAPLLGAAFALGWAPCTGPTLAAILALTAPLSGSAVPRGVALAGAYSIGLGLPFILLAAGWASAGRASGWLRRHSRAIQLAGGVLLIVVGILMAAGVWVSLTTWLQTHLIGSFETVI